MLGRNRCTSKRPYSLRPCEHSHAELSYNILPSFGYPSQREATGRSRQAMVWIQQRPSVTLSVASGGSADQGRPSTEKAERRVSTCGPNAELRPRRKIRHASKRRREREAISVHRRSHPPEHQRSANDSFRDSRHLHRRVITWGEYKETAQVC